MTWYVWYIQPLHFLCGDEKLINSQDFSNPLVRDHLHFYPEITTTIFESWQAGKYVNEIEDDDLSPMWANWDGSSHRHFYIKELAQCKNGKYFVPLKWIVYEKLVHCDAYSVIREAVGHLHTFLFRLSLISASQSGIFTVEEHTIVRVLATDFRYNFLDLREQGEIKFSGKLDTGITIYYVKQNDRSSKCF
jgi:hypothetical protein